MIGPGKYDNEAALLMAQLKAKGIFLLVLEGEQGNGVSCKLTSDLAAIMPTLLEKIATEMREDHQDLARQAFFDLKKHVEDQDWGTPSGGVSCGANFPGKTYFRNKKK